MTSIRLSRRRYWARLTPLERALENAANLRDMQYDDAAAAKVLDVALKRNADAAAVDRARALAARAELAVALGEAERLAAVRAELQTVTLSGEERSASATNCGRRRNWRRCRGRAGQVPMLRGDTRSSNGQDWTSPFFPYHRSAIRSSSLMTPSSSSTRAR